MNINKSITNTVLLLVLLPVTVLRLVKEPPLQTSTIFTIQY